MDDFDLRDLLSPPMRFQTQWSDPNPARNKPMPAPKEPQVLAMAYVPNQIWQELYDAAEGFPKGTIFRQLDLPFEGGHRHD